MAELRTYGPEAGAVLAEFDYDIDRIARALAELRLEVSYTPAWALSDDVCVATGGAHVPHEATPMGGATIVVCVRCGAELPSSRPAEDTEKGTP
jgi:hypothetical protein